MSNANVIELVCRALMLLRNSAKAHWTLQELSWTLHPPGSPEVWDGLMRWFVDYTGVHSELCQSPYVRRWRAAAIRVMQ